MTDRKTIEISTDLYDRLVQQKGTDTWDEYLGKMYEASYGDTAYLNATTLDDFEADPTDIHSSTFQIDTEEDVEVVVEEPDGSMLASLGVPVRPEERALRVRVREQPSTDT